MSLINKTLVIFFLLLTLIFLIYLFPAPHMFMVTSLLGGLLFVYQTLMVLKDKGA